MNTFSKIVTTILIIFLALMAFNSLARAQGCTEEVTPYGCGHYIETHIYLRAQSDGDWIQHESPTTHPANNVDSFTQYVNKFTLTFTEAADKVLWVSTQPSAVMGHHNYTLGASGGISALDLWIGDETGNYIDLDSLTSTNYGFWVHVKGFKAEI